MYGQCKNVSICPKGLISTIYAYLLGRKVTLDPLPVIAKWKLHLPDISDDDLSDMFESHLLVSPAVNNKLIQLYITHQCYLTPSKLHKMGRMAAPACIRCGYEPADFWHMMWACPVLQGFWAEVTAFLTAILHREVPLEPLVCLFGLLDEEVWQPHVRIMLRETLFFARKTIALKWMDRGSPRLHTWNNLVNKAVLCEKLVYLHRRCPAKFDKVWLPWCDSSSTSYSPDIVTSISL